MSDPELKYGQLKLSREQEERIWTMNTEEIKSFMHELAVEQGLAVPDTMNPSLLLPVAEPAAAVVKEATATTKFTAVETIGGTECTFSADSQAELDRAIANAYRVAMEIAPPAAQSRDAQGRFVSAQDQGRADEEAAQRAELEQQFRLGLITPEQFVEKSGVIGQYLTERGIDVAEIQESQDRRYEQSWKEASAEFVNTPEGRTWPGGEKNLEILGMKIYALNLQNANDKVAALKAAYEEMKKAGTIFPTEAAAGSAASKTGDVDEAAFAAARTPEELRALAHKAVGMDPRVSTTGMWGSR
jgi:hypothetical protein